MNPAGSAKTPPPEERLLKLIRGKGPQAGAAAAASQDTSVPVLPRHWHGRAARWPRWVGGLLGLVLVAEIGLVVFQLLRPTPSLEPARVPPTSTIDRVSPAQLPTPPPLAAHAGRALFVAPARVATPPQTTRPPTVRVKSLASRLSLLGIVAGDPAQAIIEDSDTKKSYFVTTGQTVVDGAVMIEILKNRVILDVFGDRLELSL